MVEESFELKEDMVEESSIQLLCAYIKWNLDPIILFNHISQPPTLTKPQLKNQCRPYYELRPRSYPKFIK